MSRWTYYLFKLSNISNKLQSYFCIIKHKTLCRPTFLASVKTSCYKLTCFLSKYKSLLFANENTVVIYFLWLYLTDNINLYFLFYFIPVDPFQCYTLVHSWSVKSTLIMHFKWWINTLFCCICEYNEGTMTVRVSHEHKMKKEVNSKSPPPSQHTHA